MGRDARANRRVRSGGVFIGIAAAENARFTDFWDSLLHVGASCPVKVEIERGSNIAFNRNRLTVTFLKSECDWILYLDDDQILLPGTIDRLIAHGKDVVSGVYLCRDYPFLPLVFGRENEDGKVGFRECKADETGLIPIVSAGAGCLLVHRRVIETLTFPYWTIGQIQPDALSDDIDFCRRVRQAGFEIWCDLDTRVGHKSQCSLWPERTEKGWGCTLVTSNRPVCHIPPPVTETHGV